MTTGRGPTGADWDADPVRPPPWPGYSGGAGQPPNPWGEPGTPPTTPAVAGTGGAAWDRPSGSSSNPGGAVSTGWGSAGPAGASSTTVGGTSGPPTWLLILAVLIPLATVPLLFVPDKLWVNIVGWAVAIFGSLGFLTAFTVIDLRRRTSRWYVDRPGLLATLRIAALAIGLVVAGCQAYQIADFVARMDVWVT